MSPVAQVVLTKVCISPPDEIVGIGDERALWRKVRMVQTYLAVDNGLHHGVEHQVSFRSRQGSQCFRSGEQIRAQI